MNVVSKRGLLQLLKDASKEVIAEVITWYKVARAAEWKSLEDVRGDYPAADQVGSVLIFNIRGNRYRLIVTVVFRLQKIYVKALLTHKEYDRKEWTKWE